MSDQPICARSALFMEILEADNLILAAKNACKGKTQRHRYRRYSRNALYNVMRLREDILNGTYRPQPPHEFKIFCNSGQKTRLIAAPKIRDLVLQHAIYQKIYDIFDKGFIFDSYGCRKRKGAHRASNRLTHFLRQAGPGAYFLQLDIRKFYYNIDRRILRQQLLRRIPADVADLILGQYELTRATGLHVGAMLSQLLGLIYLDGLDHYIKRVLKVKRYVRYVDDMVLICDSKQQCIELDGEIHEYIKGLGLEYSKRILSPVRRGINFVGFRSWPYCKLLRKRAFRTLGKALKVRCARAIQSIVGNACKTHSIAFVFSKISAYQEL